jgi:hypothetical protein
LGLHMRWPPLQILAFSVIHVLGTLSLLAILTLTVGCQELEDEKLDQEVSSSQIFEVMFEAHGEKSMSDVNKGEWVVREQSQKLYTSAPHYFANSDQVLSKEEDEENITTEILTTRYEGENLTAVDQAVHECRTDKSGEFFYDCQPAPFQFTYGLLNAALAVRSFNKIRALMNPFENQPMSSRISFHGLKVSKSVISPPQEVADSENCRGLSPCKIAVTDISYDVAVWQGAEYELTRVSVRISPDVPYLASRLKDCSYFRWQVSNRMVPVTICRSVVDFKFGTP